MLLTKELQVGQPGLCKRVSACLRYVEKVGEEEERGGEVGRGEEGPRAAD